MLKNKNKAILCAIASITMMNTPLVLEVNAMSNKQSVEQRSTTTKMQVVNTDTLNVREKASAKSKKLGSLKKGQTIEVISISKGWAKFNFKGNTAYVSADYLKEVKNTNTQSSNYKKREMSVTANSLTVRKGAGTKYASLGKLKKGDVVIAVQESKNGWTKIEYKNKFGYVSSSYLKKGAYVEDRKNANKVIAKIKALPSKITLRDKNAVVKARKDYNALNKNAKKLVTNLSVLEKAESTIVKLEDKESANKVIAKIKALPSKITLRDKNAVVKARKDYNALNKNAKKLVTNLSVLEKAESKIAALEKEAEITKLNQESANKVIELINKLDRVITLDDSELVKTARNAFDRLNKEAKELVINLSVLEKAESTIAELEKEEINQLNQSSANKVIELIKELDRVITLDDSELVKTARNAFDRLNKEAKELVINLSVLEKAESTIAELEKEAEIAKLNVIKANEVMAQINKLDKVITLHDSSLINNTRQAFDRLNKEAKELVTNVDILIRAEDTLSEVRYAIKLMNQLPANIQLEHKVQVQEARRVFESLSKEAQNSVSDLQLAILISAESKIKELELEGAHKLIAQDLVERIENLNKTIEYTDAVEIKSIRSSYDSLIYNAKQEVTNYNDFLAAERKLNDVYCLLIATEHLIKELPAEITLADKDAIEEAYEKYNNLSSNNKLGVNSDLVSKLDNAMSTLRGLENSR